jgi:zinc finger RNA-binding protein
LDCNVCLSNLFYFVYLRLLAFRQIYKVLGMEPLPAPKQWRLARKRRRESAEGAEDLAEEKKDKKEAQ